MSKLINIDDFARVSALTEDAVRAANGRRAANRGSEAPEDSSRPILADEQAKKAKYQAEKARLDVEEQLRLLIPAAEVADAMATAGGALARRLDALHTRAEELAAVVARDGVQGLRAALKALAREMREGLAADMTASRDESADELIRYDEVDALPAGPDETKIKISRFATAGRP